MSLCVLKGDSMDKKFTKRVSIITMGIILAISLIMSIFVGGVFESTATIFYVQNTIPSTTPTDAVNETQASTIAETTEATLNKNLYRDNVVEKMELTQGETKILNLSEKEIKKLEGFSSSNNNIVAVDDGGRVDAISVGNATVSAEFKDGSKCDFEITVTESDETPSLYDGYSTAIIANQDILQANIDSNSYNELYFIRVNRQENCVTVYTYDENGEYTIPVRAMICSCGADNGTITGNFDIYFKNEWHALYQNCYGHYVSGISGDYLFHSVPYFTASPDDLEVEEFNKLGTSASLGCVRMETADVKWIFENCPYYTDIEIYDDDEPGPLGKPDAIKITDLSCGWDPTDDNELNPYKNAKPSIIGLTNTVLSVGDDFYALGGIKAYDTCGNEITNKLSVVGNVITSKAGIYKITYSVEDVMHRSVSADIYVTVK